MLRSAIEALAEAALITTAKTTRGLIVTICQYEYYQNPANYEAHYEDAAKPSTKPETTPHYIQELKNDKNGRGTPRSFSYKRFDQLDRERAAAALGGVGNLGRYRDRGIGIFGLINSLVS